jgi:cytoplasmic iron level regulating protein YaaA (DUF328/UPF0246 family)
MIAILSPSKTQDFESPLLTQSFTEGRFHKESEELVRNLLGYSEEDLMKLMSISENLAHLNFRRYQEFEGDYDEMNSRQALLAFKGDVYTHIEVDQYTEDDFAYAQDHLRTISGLYGLLRPLDRMQPYRLEMKTGLRNDKGKNLYEFWGEQLRETLESDLNEQGDRVLVNLASKEYSKVLHLKKIDADIVNVVFKEKKPDAEPKIIALFAKLARGMMANFIVRNRLSAPDQLKDFKQTGYKYREDLSSDKEMVFVRTQV